METAGNLGKGCGYLIVKSVFARFSMKFFITGETAWW